MPKRICLLILFLFGITTMLPNPSCSGAEPGQDGSSLTSQAMLLELGALPLAALPTRPQSLGVDDDGVIRYQKGMSIGWARPPVKLRDGANPFAGVEGWIKPQFAMLKELVPPEVQQRYGLPKPALSFARYMELISLPESTDILQRKLIISFALDELQCRNIKIEDKEPLLKLCQTSDELAGAALNLLGRQGVLSSRDIMQVYANGKQPVVFSHLPACSAEDAEYLAFLGKAAGEEKLPPLSRFLAGRMLFSANSSKRDMLKALIRDGLKTESTWFGRFEMGRAALDIGDADCEQLVRELLLADPTCEVREQLLLAIAERKQEQKYIGAALDVCDGKGKPCKGVTVSRSCNQLARSIENFLAEAVKQGGLEQSSLDRITAAHEKLKSLDEDRNLEQGHER